MSLQYPVLYVFVVQCKYLCVYGGSGKDSSVKTTEKMKKAEKDKAAEEKKKAEKEKTKKEESSGNCKAL